MSSLPHPHPPSHQTVRLSAGKHRSPSEGACVMELASMLAGESFTDHPKSVCRAIAAFLRAYNDAIDDTRRQDLYPCAAAVVGTRASRATERARVARCELELDDLRGATPGRLRRTGRAVRRLHPAAGTGLFCELARALSASDTGHLRALSLVNDLIAVANRPSPPPRVTADVPEPSDSREVPTPF